ncbi:MAG: hypothetical protein WC802_03450 [Patescibacteria group bacterium]|jgi:hypothetical protein
MTNLLKLPAGQLLALVGKFAQAGMSMEEAEECLADKDALKRRVDAFKGANAPEPAPAPLRFKRIDEHTLEVYNDVPSQLPFDTAERAWNVVKPSTVIFTWQGTGKDRILLRNGVPMTFHVDPAQLADGGINGQVLWDEKLKAVPGHSSKNELDALKANLDFIPEGWKTAGAIFFWGEGFRSPVSAGVCVCYLDWSGRHWCVYYGWLSGRWDGSYPAAVSASPSTVT